MKALITGASSGIGKELALQLSKQGYELILVARNKTKLKEVQSLMTTPTTIVAMDISVVENCHSLYLQYPDIDLLINNAGFGDCGQFVETDLDKELQMINTNIVALHTLTKLYLSTMKNKNSGIILNVASVASFIPGPLMATYYSTKAYVIRLSEAIREELNQEHSNVQISVLCPGPVHTNFNEVANVQFALKGLSSDYVAKVTLKQLFKGKFYIIPGYANKFVPLLSKIIPARLIAKATYYVQKSKINEKK